MYTIIQSFGSLGYPESKSTIVLGNPTQVYASPHPVLCLPPLPSSPRSTPCCLQLSSSLRVLRLSTAVRSFFLPALQRRVTCAAGQQTANAACCALFPVLEDIQTNMFAGDTCSDASHTALRVAFHDAIGFSTTQKSFGTGADGSIFLFGETELGFDANLGIADAFNLEVPFIKKHNISVADFIQFAATVSLTKCPGILQPPFMFGRVDATAPAPDGTVPEPFQNVDVILARMADAGLTAADTVALLASHSIAGADDVDPTLSGLPFDSTPSIFDTQFFVETQLRGTLFPGSSGNQGEVMSAIAGEIRLQSDHLLARDTATNCLWQANVNNQAHMASSFQAAFLKMGLLGQDVSKMVDCSDVIPTPPPLAAANAQSVFPPGLTHADVEQACATTMFPNLATAPGAALTVPQIVQSPLTDGDCDDDGEGCDFSSFA
ncbi:manganese peroxidase isozyme precursor [Roridomyces roridus]|uniref:Peroxidase n=1 Tax=Roridomyces roridus TaxID=1738132 RepID=A0AAD7BBL3_9AGAR|nr:manganese peroxidase isozyme precursor [Roridomyces roridus]